MCFALIVLLVFGVIEVSPHSSNTTTVSFRINTTEDLTTTLNNRIIEPDTNIVVIITTPLLDTVDPTISITIPNTSSVTIQCTTPPNQNVSLNCKSPTSICFLHIGGNLTLNGCGILGSIKSDNATSVVVNNSVIDGMKRVSPLIATSTRYIIVQNADIVNGKSTASGGCLLLSHVSHILLDKVRIQNCSSLDRGGCVAIRNDYPSSLSFLLECTKDTSVLLRDVSLLGCLSTFGSGGSMTVMCVNNLTLQNFVADGGNANFSGGCLQTTEIIN
eukprot:PhF_6_TR40682/c1_g1_i3/m.61130